MCKSACRPSRRRARCWASKRPRPSVICWTRRSLGFATPLRRGSSNAAVAMDSEYLRATYDARFSLKEREDKRILWGALCEEVFQDYVPIDGTVLDVGAGFCEFSNAIRA